MELLPSVNRAPLFSEPVMLNPAEMADSTPMAIFLETLYFKPPTSDKPNPSDAEELLDREMLDNWLLPSKLGLMDLLLLVLKLTFFKSAW